MQDLHDFYLLIKSRVPIIILETYDEQKAVDIIVKVCMKQKLGCFTWTVSDGMTKRNFGDGLSLQKTPENPTQILKEIKSLSRPSVVVLCDYHPYLDSRPDHVRLLKDIALSYTERNITVVMLSHAIEMPPELKPYCATFALSLPDEPKIFSIVKEEAEIWSRENDRRRVKSDSVTIKKIVKNLKGMTELSTRRLARAIIRDDGAITEEDIAEVNKAKFELLDMDGVLSFEYDTEKFSAVGGLRNLKLWLHDRRNILSTDLGSEKEKLPLDNPKGILLLGIQGSGKSLAAKAVAGLWGVPLLRLDMGTLYNKYIGETEKNLRIALHQAELMEPCVLWIDEIEKGMAVGKSDDSTSQRVLGTLLTWMAEKKQMVFVVATANDIAELPPELMRKGRMDEIFFVDLPTEDIRKEIFEIHLRKRKLLSTGIDTCILAAASEGFSGAEIEQAIVSSLYSVSTKNKTLETQDIVSEIENTYPLSVVMAEKIDSLREWSEGRTVKAN